MINLEAEKTKTVTITQQQYDSLMEDSLWLSALECAGVDNWGGLDIAQDLYNEWKAEEKLRHSA